MRAQGLAPAALQALQSAPNGPSVAMLEGLLMEDAADQPKNVIAAYDKAIRMSSTTPSGYAITTSRHAVLILIL